MTVLRTKEGALTERVARALLGAPDGVDAEKGTIRFRDISINISTGRFFDYEDETAGDHLDLVRRFKNLQNGGAEAWLEQNVIKAAPLPLPDDSAAERALIGMLAAQPELMAAIEEEVTVDHFAEPLHKQMFAAIAAIPFDPGKPISLKALMAAAGGDPLLPCFEGYTLSRYVATIVAQAPTAVDAAHLARTIAANVRSQANREGDVDDDYDLDPEPAPFFSQFGGLPFERLDEPGLEHAHVIDGLITVGDKSVVGGPSKSGKSFLAIHMAMCIGTGMAFFGRKILSPGLVIYQAGEGGRGIKKRFRAWRQHFGLSKDKRVPVYILQSKVDIHSPDGDTGKLIAEVKGVSELYGMPVVALFIDTLAKASGMADENSGRDMGTVMANVDRIADAVPGCHVCLVHHMNAGGTKLRGHTSVYAGVDQVILVTKDEAAKMSTAVLDKQKDDEDGAKINFSLLRVETGTRPGDGKAITSCVVEAVGGVSPGPSAQPKGPRLTPERRVILQALRTAVEDYGEPPPPVLRLPKSIFRVVHAQYWKRVYLEKAPDPEAVDNTINKRIRDASNQLQDLKLIGRTNPYVWIVPSKAATEALQSLDTPGEAFEGFK